MDTTYEIRNDIRQSKLNQATEELINWFVANQSVSEMEAKRQVQELSSEVALWIFPYVLGNTQPLIDAINSSSLPFMDAGAKANVVGNLSF
jgi:hypothetical protein